MLRRLHEIVASARPMPLSTSVMMNRDEVLELLDETIERLPDELRAARWLLKEREEFLAKVQREGDDILDQARRVPSAWCSAPRSCRRARPAPGDRRAGQDEAARLRNEAEDYCDHKLASFEIVLDRTMKTVGRAREAPGRRPRR